MERSDIRRIDIFFYGLFMDADALRAKGLHPVNVRQCQVRGMALRIGKRAALVASPLDTCHGFVMQLTQAEIDQLYSDPSVAMYRPQTVKAELADGTEISAVCFNLSVPPGPEEANPDYADRLRALARRLGLPSAYTERLR